LASSDNNDYNSVKYVGLLPVMIESIKNQPKNLSTQKDIQKIEKPDQQISATKTKSSTFKHFP
jgi:cell division protein FtsL